MKQGLKSIESLYGELMRQREMRKDLIADTRRNPDTYGQLIFDKGGKIIK